MLSDQGRSDEAGPVFHESIDARRAVGIPLEIAEALSLLGRHEARVGNFAEAHAGLRRGAQRCTRSTATSSASSRPTRDSSNASPSRAARRTSSRQRSKHSHARETVDGTSVLAAALHRQRGFGLAQTGDLSAARVAFEESLATARRGGENYGLISNEYEVALTLDALSRVERLAGNDVGGLEAERDAIPRGSASCGYRSRRSALGAGPPVPAGRDGHVEEAVVVAADVLAAPARDDRVRRPGACPGRS